jgi:anti-sigma B factor antagonist
MPKMSDWPKFEFVICHRQCSLGLYLHKKIYQIFMVPNTIGARLFTSMQTIDTNWQTWKQPELPVGFRQEKEPKLKLSLEIRNHGDVIVVHCQGRIVYREEAAALSTIVGDVMEHAGQVLLDLSGVSSIDSAGLGELALLYTRSQEKNVSLICAGANSLVRTVLELTNLDTVLNLHSSIESGLEAFREEQVPADC